MNKPYTMVFYEIQNEKDDYFQDKIDATSESESEQDQQLGHQHPNAFILSLPVEKVSLKLLKERFPWRIIQKLQKSPKQNWNMQFKIKEINDKANDINLWITLNNENQNVPIYSGDNIIFVKIKKA